MRKYKALVVNGKGILKGIGIVVLSSAVTVSAINITGKRYEKGAEEILNENISQAVTVPYNKDCVKDFGLTALKAVLGFVPTETESVLMDAIPIYSKRNNSVPEFTGDKTEPFEDKYELQQRVIEEEIQIPTENQAPIKSIDGKQIPNEGESIAIGNETSYNVNINEILKETPKIDMTVKGPKVLITHTHATESYAREGATVYDVTESDRKDDINKNVVAVGAHLYEILNSYGIDTLHDKALHDKPSFNGSYAHSLSSIERYKEKYPTIQVVFDIHRDSIVYSDKVKAKTVTSIKGRPAAQLMFVVGTDEKGLVHPNWRENLTSAVHFQRVITEKYPSLMRRINLRQERFNGHTTSASVIIEVGTSGNSLSEAIYGIELLGECIGDYLKGM